MADEKEKLATEKETKQVAQERLSVNRENKAIDQETLEIQRRIRDAQFGIVEELKEQFGIRTRISEQDKQSLSLSRQVSSALSESNRELRRAGKLESQILTEKKFLAKTQQVINDSFSVLSAEGAKQLTTALAIAKVTKLQTEDYARYLETVNEVDRALINQIVLGKTQADNIVDTIALREKEIGVQREVNEALGIAGALTDNLQRIGLRAFGGLGINLGVFEEGLADAKDQSTALAESFVGIDRIFAELESQDLTQALEQDADLAPRILAASEAFILTSKQAGRYQTILGEIATLDAERESTLSQIGILQAQLNEQTDRGSQEAIAIADAIEYQKEALIATEKPLKKLTEDQLELAVAAAETAKSIGPFGRKLAAIGKLGPGIGKALKQGLLDPFVLGVFSIEGMMTAFADLDKAQTDLQRSTGQTVSQFAQLELSYVTQVDILKVANALTQELGRNAMNIFPDKILHDVAEFEKMLGLSAKEAGMLGVSAQITGRSMDDIGNSIVDTVGSFNRANKSAVNQGQILKDVANASAGVSVSLGKNPEALAKAASEARRLGLELDKLDQIASSLLDFESSIENELSAQLLTGRDINMNKARELALTNDLAGLGKELFNNSVDIHEFGKMNRIQQEAMAKALGMSRDELARTAYLRALDTGMTDKQAAAAANVGLEDMKRLEVQQQLQASMEKIAQALAGPVMAFANMLESSVGLLKTLLAVVVAVKSYQGYLKAVNILQSISLGYAAKEKSMAAMKLLAEKKGLSIAIATAVAKAAANPVGALVGLAVLGGIAASIYTLAKPKQIEDGVINPDGGLMVSGPKGSIQLDPQDNIIAGTNLGGQAQSGQSNRELMSKIEELIAAVKQGGDVYLDGDKVGTALVKGSYRNS